MLLKGPRKGHSVCRPRELRAILMSLVVFVADCLRTAHPTSNAASCILLWPLHSFRQSFLSPSLFLPSPPKLSFSLALDEPRVINLCSPLALGLLPSRDQMDACNAHNALPKHQWELPQWRAQYSSTTPRASCVPPLLTHLTHRSSVLSDSLCSLRSRRLGFVLCCACALVRPSEQPSPSNNCRRANLAVGGAASLTLLVRLCCAADRPFAALLS